MAYNEKGLDRRLNKQMQCGNLIKAFDIDSTTHSAPP